MKDQQLELGDVFEIDLGKRSAAHFQWVAIDESQLRSDVIRVFSSDGNATVMDVSELADHPISFYAHCVIKVGVRLDAWKKVGNIACPKQLDVIFRSSRDFGQEDIKVSKQWTVWRVSEPRVFVGKLSPDLMSAEPGEVFPPAEIIYRIRHGHYKQSYQS